MGGPIASGSGIEGAAAARTSASTTGRCTAPKGSAGEFSKKHHFQWHVICRWMQGTCASFSVAASAPYSLDCGQLMWT